MIIEYEEYYFPFFLAFLYYIFNLVKMSITMRIYFANLLLQKKKSHQRLRSEKQLTQGLK